jgi:hypothetical protein
MIKDINVDINVGRIIGMDTDMNIDTDTDFGHVVLSTKRQCR